MALHGYFSAPLLCAAIVRGKIKRGECGRQNVSTAYTVAMYDRQRAPPRRYYRDTNKLRMRTLPPPTGCNNTHRYVVHARAARISPLVPGAATIRPIRMH